MGTVGSCTTRRAREQRVGKVHSHGNSVAFGLGAANWAMRRGRTGAELSHRHLVGIASHGDLHTEAEKRYVA